MRFLYFIISSSLLIGLVLVIRKLFQKSLAPGVIYALWLIPLIRLLVPFAGWEMPVFGTMADILNSPQALVSEWMDEQEDSQGGAVSNPEKRYVQSQEAEAVNGTKIYDAVNSENNNRAEVFKDSLTPMPETTNTSSESSYEWIAFTVWILGSILLGGYVLIQNRKLSKSVNTMKTVEEVEGLKVCVGKEVKVPCLAGLKSPKIMVPEEILNDSQLYHCVLQHELAHYHQKDHIWTAVKIFLCVLYWWNPLVWLAAICMEEDAELACDARVLKDKNVEERKAYGYALLKILENAQEKKYSFCVATSLSGNQKSMKRRITEISSATATKRQVILPLFLLVMVVFVIGCGVPTTKSWMREVMFDAGANANGGFYKLEYEFVLQDDIKSRVIYYEIYEYGELTERHIASYGELSEEDNSLKLRMETRPEEHVLILGNENVEAEIKIQNPKYVSGSRSGSFLIYDQEKIEITPGDDYVLIADYQIKAGDSTESNSCEQLSEMNERQLQKSLKGHSLTTLVRMVFSDKSEKELYEFYKQKEHSLYEETLGKPQPVAALKVNDLLYYDTGETSPMGDADAVAGHIRSSVGPTETPVGNEESNFGCIGYPYTSDEGDGWIMVYMDDGKYHIFSRREEISSEMFAENWAEAFVSRDAETIAEMANAEAYEQLKTAGLLGEGDDYIYFGWSSPWPMFGNQQYEIVNCNDLGAEIRYYATFSTPHVYTWEEFLEFEKVDGSLKVKSESLRTFDEIHEKEMFYQAYPDGKVTGTMMDYYTNGLGEVLNENALEDPEARGYRELFKPDTALAELLNISKDEELVSYSVEDTGGEAIVQIHFLQGNGIVDTVEVTMWQPYGEDGIWIPK